LDASLGVATTEIEAIARERADRDAWREQAQRLALPAPKPVEQPPLGWWAWLRSTG
jgi:hypothetical protein